MGEVSIWHWVVIGAVFIVPGFVVLAVISKKK